MDDVDDVEITDVNDDDDMAFGAEEGPVKNQDLGSLSAIAGELLSQYGWALLVLTVLLYLLVQHLSKKRSSRSSGPRTHHDSEVVARNQEAMEAARRRMQEELDAKAAIFKDKQKQQEEEKRRQKIEMWDSMQQGKSYKGPGTRLAQPADEEPGPSSALKPKTDRKSLRSSDYSPLSGQGGGSCAWRPGRRGPSAGG